MARFRQLWFEDYILSLRERGDLLRNSTVDTHLGEVTVVKISEKARLFCALGQITHMLRGDNGLVRSARVKRGDGSKRVHIVKHLYPLDLGDDNYWGHTLKIHWSQVQLRWSTTDDAHVYFLSRV